MIKIDKHTADLVKRLNALDPNGPEMSRISDPMKAILKELAKVNDDEQKLPVGSLTDEQWSIVGKVNELSVHMGFDLVVEPFDDDSVPENMRDQNLLLFREHPSGVVLNYVEIIPDKMDTILTVIFWLIQSLFTYYKSKYVAIEASKPNEADSVRD